MNKLVRSPAIKGAFCALAVSLRSRFPEGARKVMLLSVSIVNGVIFSACNVTKTAMEKAEGHAIAIVPEARIVPA